jgi:hypothetical protein
MQLQRHCHNILLSLKTRVRHLFVFLEVRESRKKSFHHGSSADESMQDFTSAPSEKGFALVLAVLATMILLSLAILVYLLSTQDSRLSSRLVGEKKALTAVEAGIHALTYSFNPAGGAIAWTQVDPANDAASRYRISAPTRPATGEGWRPLSGYAMSGGQLWGMQLYNMTVTGENTTYSSRVDVDVQVGYGPVEIGTVYR